MPDTRHDQVLADRPEAGGSPTGDDPNAEGDDPRAAAGRSSSSAEKAREAAQAAKEALEGLSGGDQGGKSDGPGSEDRNAAKSAYSLAEELNSRAAAAGAPESG